MRKNDIVFFNLHRRYINSFTKYGGFLGIFSLAAFLNANGYESQSFAGQLVEGKKLLDEICSTKSVSMIGLYCDYENVTENIFLCQYIKKTYNLPVIVGGPQATALDKDFMEKSGCDAVVRYEGEFTVLELVNYFIDGSGALSKIKGIMYLKNGGAVINQEQDIIENLDSLPFIDENCYLVPNKRSYELSIMTGRGCPFHCAFCHEGHHTKKVRFRSVENVLEEIERFVSKQHSSNNIFIMFTDDTFTLIPKRVKELCAALKALRQKSEFNWFCEGHIHTLYLHPEMIDYIAEAGAQRIQLGIEAGTQEVLDAYRKGSTLKEIESVIVKCRDAGIQQIFSNIILGGALFTREIYEKNLAYAKKLIELGKGSVEIAVVCYWPLAETSITNNPEQYGIRIIDKDFITSVGDFPQTETESLNKWDILQMAQDMDKEIEKHMCQILTENKVPQNRILSWFPQSNTVKAVGRWWYCLSTLPHIFNYYQMIYTGEAFSTIGQNLKDGDYFGLHPMRTVMLQKYMQVLDKGRTKIFDYVLDVLEQEILIYATGKLSVTDIYEHILQYHSVLARDFSFEKLVIILKKLEKAHLIVFSHY